MKSMFDNQVWKERKCQTTFNTISTTSIYAYINCIIGNVDGCYNSIYIYIVIWIHIKYDMG